MSNNINAIHTHSESLARCNSYRYSQQNLGFSCYIVLSVHVDVHVMFVCVSGDEVCMCVRETER